MTDATPRVVSIDPNDPVPPQSIGPPTDGAGEVVVVLVENAALSRAWAGRLAVELATRWATGGARVTLCDGDLLDPRLHFELGVENQEGLGDLILFGASPRRVARRVEGREFLFVASGTVVPDPPAVYRHPRWDSILSAFRESGTVLLMYLPWTAEGVADIVGRADRVVRLTAHRPSLDPEPGVVVIHPLSAAVGGNTAPSAAVAEGLEPEVDSEGSADADAEASAGAEASSDPEVPSDPLDTVEPHSSVRSSTGSGIEVVTEEIPESWDDTDAYGRPPGEDVGEEAETIPSLSARDDVRPSDSAPPARPVSSGREKRSLSSPWLFLVLLVVVGVVLVAAWFGVITVPGLTPASSVG